jgi:hypothetical protein
VAQLPRSLSGQPQASQFTARRVYLNMGISDRKVPERTRVLARNRHGREDEGVGKERKKSRLASSNSFKAHLIRLKTLVLLRPEYSSLQGQRNVFSAVMLI